MLTPSPLRVIFAGTPEFARTALEAIVAAGHTVPLVLTQPDRPAGRGMKLQASPVKQCALEHGIPVAQPRSLRLDGKYPQDAAEARAALEAAQADVMVVAAYGLILPTWTLELPPHGCLNIHASLLPRWRGAAPIHRAIEAGDAETGVTIMQMDAGLDTGDMLLAERLPIGPRATTAALHDELAALGGRLIVEALAGAARGALTATTLARGEWSGAMRWAPVRRVSAPARITTFCFRFLPAGALAAGLRFAAVAVLDALAVLDFFAAAIIWTLPCIRSRP